MAKVNAAHQKVNAKVFVFVPKRKVRLPENETVFFSYKTRASAPIKNQSPSPVTMKRSSTSVQPPPTKRIANNTVKRITSLDEDPIPMVYDQVSLEEVNTQVIEENQTSFGFFEYNLNNRINEDGSDEWALLSSQWSSMIPSNIFITGMAVATVRKPDGQQIEWVVLLTNGFHREKKLALKMHEIVSEERKKLLLSSYKK